VPVQKYRSVADMPRLERVADERLEAQIRAVWGRAFRLAPAFFTPGVRRFRSMHDANEARAAEIAERLRRTRERG
jgi:hypothetical protein